MLQAIMPKSRERVWGILSAMEAGGRWERGAIIPGILVVGNVHWWRDGCLTIVRLKPKHESL